MYNVLDDLPHTILYTAAPTIQPLIMTNDMAVEDQLLGTLIVAHSGTANLVITIIVTSDPCPTVQWRLDGVVITADANYIFGTPCGASEAVSPFMLTLTIGNHTLATSGEYSATVANSAGSTAASIHVTVPGKRSGADPGEGAWEPPP